MVKNPGKEMVVLVYFTIWLKIFSFYQDYGKTRQFMKNSKIMSG